MAATNPTIDALANITTTGGLYAASFAEIKNAYAEKMKSIYGNDIDISSASADGQYVMMEALVINNIYRTLEALYKNIQPASATGKYLDILAGFTNTVRNMGTRSYVYLEVTYKGDNTSDTPRYLETKDQYGNIWGWINPIDISGIPQISFDKDVAQIIKFASKTIGPVEATTTSKFSYLENSSYDFEIDEDNFSFGLGSYKETDAELRQRRLFKSGVRSITTIDTLRSWLYDISGVKDVFIFNNNTGAAKTAPDGQSVGNNKVYVVIRVPQMNMGTAFDNEVGMSIFDALTPGVQTQSSSKSLTIDLFSTSNGSVVSSAVYWKQAQKSSTKFKVNYTLLNGATLSDAQKSTIKEAIKNYLNNFSISGTLFASDLINIINKTDLKTPIEGFNTFYCTSVEAATNSSFAQISKYSMPLEYFDFTDADISFNNQNTFIQIGDPSNAGN